MQGYETLIKKYADESQASFVNLRLENCQFGLMLAGDVAYLSFTLTS